MEEEVLLSQKTCVACQEGMPVLSEKMINELLLKLGNGWYINNVGRLCKDYKLSNFLDAIKLANMICVVSEKEAHHPNLSISWGKCKVEIWTHKVGALTKNDFILASKITEL